jgi:hypothetical protein
MINGRRQTSRRRLIACLDKGRHLKISADVHAIIGSDDRGVVNGA